MTKTGVKMSLYDLLDFIHILAHIVVFCLYLFCFLLKAVTRLCCDVVHITAQR